jgi:chromosome segregation ATPase
MDIEKHKKKLMLAGIGVSAIAVFGVLSTIIFSALKGLVAFAAFGIVGGTLIAFTPWFTMKLTNWRLKAIKHEARTNPIETQENILIQRLSAWKETEKKIRDFSGAVEAFRIKAQRFAQKYPDKAEEYNLQHRRMQQLLDLRKQRLKEAADGLNMMRDALEEQKARYEMALEALKVERASDTIDANSVMDSLKIKEAMDSVDLTVSRAFSELESITLQMEYDPNRGERLVIPTGIEQEVPR